MRPIPWRPTRAAGGTAAECALEEDADETKSVVTHSPGGGDGCCDGVRWLAYEFDVAHRAYTGDQWFYRLASASHAIGDLTSVTDRLYLVIERDNFQGAAAQFKKIFLVDLDDVDGEGFLVKHQVADLLQIADPDNIGGHGPVFRFPFQTIESVIPFGERELGVLDDNNYPFSNGRVPGQPDPNELIVIRLDRPLVQDARSAR